MICMQYLTALKVKPVALTRVRHLAIGYFVSQSVSSYVENFMLFGWHIFVLEYCM